LAFNTKFTSEGQSNDKFRLPVTSREKEGCGQGFYAAFEVKIERDATT